MITEQTERVRKQIQLVSIDDLVPQNHLLRIIDKDDNKPNGGSGEKFEDYTDDVPLDGKTIKCSITDPESGWFRKGEHKHQMKRNTIIVHQFHTIHFFTFSNKLCNLYK